MPSTLELRFATLCKGKSTVCTERIVVKWSSLLCIEAWFRCNHEEAWDSEKQRDESEASSVEVDLLYD